MNKEVEVVGVKFVGVRFRECLLFLVKLLLDEEEEDCIDKKYFFLIVFEVLFMRFRIYGSVV